MEIRYKRDLNSNYLILTEEKTAAETYETRMLTENRIHGFLFEREKTVRSLKP